ncbi:hypothetical protein BDV36DRAFT_282547 [Aspergillus pseudocaelatus]|uniref:Isoprenoid synthase domain-containing protein n=1 Tax=Aspergillus pseudocaelatus TaxID=1825620 RepID=A0ABQ6WPB4_9EURO|nr:hypothetical protein BDV36DRAFT_282547 [Aspergillus pseudocaelatus]
MRILSFLSKQLSRGPFSSKKGPSSRLLSAQRPCFAKADSPDQEATAPDISIMDARELAHVSQDSVPSVAQAAVHLLLMDTIWTWKHNITTGETANKLLSLPTVDGLTSQWDDEKRSLQLLAGVMEAAVPRFYAWWISVDHRLTKEIPKNGFLELPADLLPPLDVMIIWHAYMLQPGLYADDCSRLKVPDMRRILFPWQAIYNAIDIMTLEYKIPSVAEDFFELITGQSVDLVEELVTTANLWVYRIRCPYCQITKKMPILNNVQTDDINQGFELECDCGYIPSVDALRHDLLHLQQTGNMCVRGTYSSSSLGHALRLLPFAKRDDLIRAIQAASSETSDSTWAVERLLSLYIPTSPVTKATSAHYSSVLRAMCFVDKMHQYCWLRSPALCYRANSNSISVSIGTLPRAQQKYQNFLQVARQPENIPITPTSDVGLFWHTHQLSPGPYRQFCIRQLGRFMDYDDKVAHEVLDKNFAATQDSYSRELSGEYDTCLCWACELEQNDHELAIDDPGISSGSDDLHEWARRVAVVFWKEVEDQRQRGQPGLARESLREVLARTRQERIVSRFG